MEIEIKIRAEISYDILKSGDGCGQQNKEVISNFIV